MKRCLPRYAQVWDAATGSPLVLSWSMGQMCATPLLARMDDTSPPEVKIWPRDYLGRRQRGENNARPPPSRPCQLYDL